MRQPHYTQQDKQQYLAICRAYNDVSAKPHDGSSDFINLSIRLHAAKGLVPKRWRSEAFVSRVGTTN